MRIASLLPSATEIICALGLADSLVGVSHECDLPPEVVAHLPKLTRSSLAPGLSSAEIDQAVSQQVGEGHSLYGLDEELLTQLRPDLVVTQELCDVCAVSFSEVKRLAKLLPGNPPVLSLNPPNIEGIFEDVISVARAAGVESRGEQLVASLRLQLQQVAKSVAGKPMPSVFMMEWLDPPFSAGHWVPEMVQLAGGREVLGRAGEKSQRVTWQQVIAEQPEFIFLIPCGYTQFQAQAEWDTLAKPAGWETIPAVQRGQVYALDANGYCSRPATRTAEGVAVLAGYLHPER